MTYDDIMTALAGAGIAVQYPGAKPGICTSPYAVVQDYGTYPYAQSTHLGYKLIEIHCYTPIGNYPALPLRSRRLSPPLPLTFDPPAARVRTTLTIHSRRIMGLCSTCSRSGFINFTMKGLI